MQCVQINIDNLSILEQFKHSNVPVCIRINPHVMAGNTNISVGHTIVNLESQFINCRSLPRRRKHKDEHRRNPYAYRF
jgi:hypothetical protein